MVSVNLHETQCFFSRNKYPRAESNETNTTGIKITEIDFASLNEVFFICKE